ncbi:MAG: phytoene desaturase family protein, partial [Bacteroidia bacterium]
MNQSSPVLYSPYKQYKHDKAFDSIVIGSGISGLALAAILSKEGKKVLVLERHYTPGGGTHTFKRADYEWDVGLHYLGEVGKPAPSMLKKSFDYICDTPIEWADMGEVYDRIYFGDETFEFRKGQAEFIDYFSKLFPHEKENIVKYVGLLNGMEKYGTGYYAEKMLPQFLSSLIGGLMRKKYLVYASKTTKEVLDELFTDKKLKAVLAAQYGDCGLPPALCSFAMHAAVARHYLDGGYYPVGGSAVLFEKIAPVIKKSGGEILIRAEVSEILVENGKAIGVKMADGKIIKAKKVVSTIGFESTYKNLLSPAVQQHKALGSRMSGLNPSVSFYCLYLGFRHTASELQLPKSNFWIFPEGYDHDKSQADFASGKSKEFPVVYISFPGAKDPDFEKRYPGRTTVEIITLINYDSFKPWADKKWKHRGEDYDTMKEEISQQLLGYLYRYLPQTRGKVDYHELSTPLTAKHFMGHQQGELYGLD